VAPAMESDWMTFFMLCSFSFWYMICDSDAGSGRRARKWRNTYNIIHRSRIVYAGSVQKDIQSAQTGPLRALDNAGKDFVGLWRFPGCFF